MYFPLELLQGNNLTDTRFWTSNLQNYKKINAYCFKPPSLQYAKNYLWGQQALTRMMLSKLGHGHPNQRCFHVLGLGDEDGDMISHIMGNWRLTACGGRC